MTVRNDHQSTSPTNLAARVMGPTLLTVRPWRSGSNTSWLVARSCNPGSGSGWAVCLLTYRPGAAVVNATWLEFRVSTANVAPTEAGLQLIEVFNGLDVLGRRGHHARRVGMIGPMSDGCSHTQQQHHYHQDQAQSEWIHSHMMSQQSVGENPVWAARHRRTRLRR